MTQQDKVEFEIKPTPKADAEDSITEEMVFECRVNGLIVATVKLVKYPEGDRALIINQDNIFELNGGGSGDALYIRNLDN